MAAKAEPPKNWPIKIDAQFKQGGKEEYMFIYLWKPLLYIPVGLFQMQWKRR